MASWATLVFFGTLCAVTSAYLPHGRTSTETEELDSILGERFPAVGTLSGGLDKDSCIGLVLKRKGFLTTAACIDAVGPNPIISIKGLKQERLNGFVSEEQVPEIKKIHVHPTWSGGDTHNGYDVALVEFAGPVDVQTPTLADPNYHMYTGFVVHAVQVEGTVETIPFHVVDGSACAQLSDGSNDNCCLYPTAGMEHLGSRGMLLMVLDQAPESDGRVNDIKRGLPALDLFVGITSFTNCSDNSGVAVVCTPSNKIRGWIDQIIP